MQIYNEKIFDLMQDKRRQNPLQLRDNHKANPKEKEGEGGAKSSGTVHVRGMSVYRIYSREEAVQLLKQGMRNRAIRATDFNSESSRSHTILQLFVTVEEEDEQGLMLLKRSTFSLVDLAGSEKWRSSLSTSTTNLQAEAAVQAQMKEMTNINTSLHVLGNCVSALIEPNRRHVPYRDSVLTRLLQDPLGGNGRTILIATIHADAGHKEETYSTLQFASRASRIKVALTVNVGINERANLVEAQKQIKMLRARLQEFQQGAQSSRSRDGSVSPSGRKQLESTSGNNGSTSAPCQQCQQNDKLIAALRAKVVELHNENQVLRGVAGGSHLSDPHLPFRAPRKPLPAGGSTSTLTKMSPSPMLLHGHGGDTSSLSSVDSVQVKKKKKATTGGKKLKRTGSKGGSRASSASGRAREETPTEGVDGEEEEDKEDQVDSQQEHIAAAPPLPVGISALDPSSNLNNSTDNLAEITTNENNPESEQRAAGVPAPHVSPVSPARATPKQVHTPIVTPAKKSTETAKSHSSHASGGLDSEGSKRTSGASSLRFSDSSIEKVLKAANMVLNAPPASSLGLLDLMGKGDGVASQPNTAEKEKIRKLKKKAKQNAMETPAAMTPSPQKEYGEKVEVPSPSPPRNKGHKQSISLQPSPAKTNQKNISAASPLRQINTSEQQDYLHSGTSTASNSFDSAHLRTSMADYLEPSSWGNMMSPPVRKAHSNKFEDNTSASYASNSTASLGSLIGSWNGVGFVDEAPATATGAYASAPRKDTTDDALSAAQRGAPTATNVTGSNATPTVAAGTGAPLPVLTPARRAVQKASNPDACAKHGLDQCVLCRMFGDDNDDTTTTITAYGASSYVAPSYGTSSYTQPAGSYADINSISYNSYDQNPAYHSSYGQESQTQAESQPVQKLKTEKKSKSQQQAAFSNNNNDYSYQAQPYTNTGYNYTPSTYPDMMNNNNFVTPQQLQIPISLPVYEQQGQQQQGQQQQWQNQSSDFSPSGIYSNALNVVENKKQSKTRKTPSTMQSPHQQQLPSSSFAYTQPTNDTFVPDTSPCKQHGITDCLMCTMNSTHANSVTTNSQPSYTMYPLNDQLNNYSVAPSHHPANNFSSSVGAHALSAASPQRFPAPQEYVSTVDSSDQIDGYGFQHSSSPAPTLRSLSGSHSKGTKGSVDNPGSSRPQGGSSSAPVLGLAHQDNLPHMQHQQQPHQGQAQQSAQVRNIKHISQQRHQQQQEYSSPAGHNNGNNNITYVGYPAGESYEPSYGQYQQQQPYPSQPAEQPPQRSVYGNSVQTVQALRQSASNFTAMHPRSTSSPLPRGQPSSILPSILNEFEYHNKGSQFDTAPPHQQQQQFGHSGHNGGGKSNITYLNEEGETGDDLDDDEEDDEDIFQPRAQQSDGRSNPQEPVGRAVIKKKKKVKKKVTRKVPAGSSAGVAAAVTKKRV